MARKCSRMVDVPRRCCARLAAVAKRRKSLLSCKHPEFTDIERSTSRPPKLSNTEASTTRTIGRTIPAVQRSVTATSNGESSQKSKGGGTAPSAHPAPKRSSTLSRPYQSTRGAPARAPLRSTCCSRAESQALM
eukprot:CAMPEP_0180576638 /NCGR_PEP_ID=MMETSP1037_2-20121125/11524_1 /TAXON_ID=632150 /ORGANISM="Azadinium spinosum, Strain 3D9" /LENGTH=133 /DNA_ID=CAMNT_0022594365 /DNA_START=191 /DNA_END=592 /DNA_ORIENTATION=+